MKIKIVEKLLAQLPEAPSHLEPGLGNDTVWFTSAQTPYPEPAVLSHLLSEECAEWCLASYDPLTGSGSFVSIDFDGPDVGTVIDLSSNTPMPEERYIVYVSEPETAISNSNENLIA